VVYRLIDPAEFAGKKVLVVGGGDSALEAAHALADETGTIVTLSYREKAFTRAKEKNRKKVEQAASEGRLTVLYESKVKQVHRDSVDIDCAEKMVSVPNDGIICCLGGILPTPFLKEIGIEVETKRGETTRAMTSTADVVQKSVAPAAECKPAALPKPAAVPRLPIEPAAPTKSEEEQLDRMAAEAAELAKRLASG
jgi:thioredoxin reductase